MSKINTIDIKNAIISITKIEEEDYICLTDMAKAKEGDNRAADVIKNWIRTRTTIEFLGTWETMYNPDFKVVEFDHFKMEAGLPTFVLSPRQWAEKTRAIGIISKSGRYGGTYAHRDIAFEFGAAISPTFKLYLIKEYQRYKEIESNQYNLEWNVKRILSKANYHIQTDAVQKHIVPEKNYTKDKEWLIYTEEADLLNVALFNCTAKDWRDLNPEQAKKELNIRDFASINELAVLSNIESLNAELIKKGIEKPERFVQLREMAVYQLEILDKKNSLKALKKLADDIYIESQRKIDK
ncbi:MAG TPA: KilA-N domain-containing protein [Saprospiraceae bacterium]|nr:KilA-N domain-containing protein [Saprospiraceae bacterium]